MSKKGEAMRQNGHDVANVEHLLAVEDRVRSVHVCLPIIEESGVCIQHKAREGSAVRVVDASAPAMNLGHAAAAIIAALWLR